MFIGVTCVLTWQPLLICHIAVIDSKRQSRDIFHALALSVLSSPRDCISSSSTPTYSCLQCPRASTAACCTASGPILHSPRRESKHHGKFLLLEHSQKSTHLCAIIRSLAGCSRHLCKDSDYWQMWGCAMPCILEKESEELPVPELGLHRLAWPSTSFWAGARHHGICARQVSFQRVPRSICQLYYPSRAVPEHQSLNKPAVPR